MLFIFFAFADFRLIVVVVLTVVGISSFLKGKGVWVGVRSRLWLGRGREQVVRRPPRRYRPMPLSVPALVPVPRPASTLQRGVGIGKLDWAEAATAFS